MKIFGVKLTGGCYCGCSTDYCQGIDFEPEEKLYLSHDLAVKAFEQKVDSDKSYG